METTSGESRNLFCRSVYASTNWSRRFWVECRVLQQIGLWVRSLWCLQQASSVKPKALLITEYVFDHSLEESNLAFSFYFWKIFFRNIINQKSVGCVFTDFSFVSFFVFFTPRKIKFVFIKFHYNSIRHTKECSYWRHLLVGIFVNGTFSNLN